MMTLTVAFLFFSARLQRNPDKRKEKGLAYRQGELSEKGLLRFRGYGLPVLHSERVSFY